MGGAHGMGEAMGHGEAMGQGDAIGHGEADDGVWIEVARRLRTVKRAQRRFLRMWNIEQTLIEPLVARVAADVEDHAEAE